jgi:hypothetical protein
LGPPDWDTHASVTQRRSPGETHDDFRARVAAERQREEEMRQRQLLEQSSLDNAPAVRIRAWEKAHGLRMPSKLGHPVLRVIATATGLPIDIVEEEQRLRAQPR